MGKLELADTLRTAPVKAPFSWPNNSLSSRFVERRIVRY